MTHRATITLDDEAHAFLAEQGGGNKSAFVNTLLKAEKRRALEEAVLAANEEEASDDYQHELAGWEATLADGLTPDA